MSRVSGFLVPALALLLGACNGAAEDSCEGLCNTLCRRATDCIQNASQTEALFHAKTATGETVTHGRNPAGRGCEMGMIRDVCGDPTKPEALFETCSAALDEARCVPDGDEQVLALPDACQGLLDCNEGPCLD
jgi:hypothetical protein